MQVILEILKKFKEMVIILMMAGLVAFLGNGLNMVGWSFIVQIRYYLLMAACCFVFASYCFVILRNERITFSFYTVFLCLWPLIPIMVAVVTDGDLGKEMRAIPTWVYVSLFFIVFHYLQFTEKRILGILFTVSLVTVAIQVLQQFFPLFAIFGGDPDDLSDVASAVGERNGLARYIVGSYHVQMLVLCYAWSKMLQTFRPQWFLLSAVMLVSIYLYLTKQILISVMFTLALSFLMVKGKRVKIMATVLFFFSVMTLAVFWDDLFADMIRESQDDTWSHQIRFEFIAFISEYNLTDPLGVLLGHGYSFPLLADWFRRMYYPSDIGFFGESIYFGWPWALAYFYVVFRILVTYRERVPVYVKLFIICSGLISIFIFPYRNRIELYNWVSVIYIASLYIDGKIKVETKNALKEE